MSKKSESAETDGSIFDLFSDLEPETPNPVKPEPPKPIPTGLSHKQRQILAKQKSKVPKQPPEDQTVIVTKGTARLPEPDEPPEALPPTPNTQVGPDRLPCGHWNWYNPTELILAQTKNICCPGYKKHVPYWPAVTTSIPTIPVGHRCTKTNPHGFCSDPKTGKYIGGTNNNCKNLLSDPNKRCLGHQP